MTIWLISQTEKRGYDTYDSAVVAAESEDAARQINPDGEWESEWTAWATSPANVTAKLIGVAEPGIEPGVILSSFNAG